jgi:hypothetical protein
MNMSVIIAELVIMCLLFLALVTSMMWITPLSFISDYPPEIQEAYYRSQHKEAIKEKINILMILKKVIALIVFLFFFAWMLHLAGASSFKEGVLLSYLYIFVVFCWDTFFIDWLLFPNIKRFRLPGTEHMDREYHQKWFHVKVCLPMIPVFIAAGCISAGLLVWIW